MPVLTVFSPYNESKIKDLPFMSEKEALSALHMAHEVFLDKNNWLKPYERRAILEKLITLMQNQRDRLAMDATREGGKPLMDSRVEADRAINGVQVAIEHIGQMTGREIPMNLNLSSANRMAFTQRYPVGVVMAVSAFNHPLNLIVHQVIPAIAVGCPVLIKPASATPMSCFNLVELLYKAGLPKAWCQVITCDNQTTEKLVSDSRISFFSFIGSSRVGWYLRSKLAAGVTCAMEHGGAAPVIIEADADLKNALPLLVKGGFYHAGQVCVSVQRIFADQSIAESLAHAIAKLAKQLKVGDPTHPETEVGPLISVKEVDRVDQWVQEAVKAGANLLCGGKKMTNTCYEPTVLWNPPMSVKVSNEEIFGPVICVYPYSNRNNAIKQANKLNFSFQAAVFTKDIDVAMNVVENLEAVTVMVNDHTAFRVDWMPFGGRKNSGLGLGGIPYSMHDMTYEKLMVIKHQLKD